jgi:hypothetical protein
MEENSERESENLKAILVLKKYACSPENSSTWKYYECAFGPQASGCRYAPDIIFSSKYALK